MEKPNPTHSTSVNGKIRAIICFALLSLPLAGQQSLDSAFRTAGTAVVAAFEAQRQVLQTSSAVILDGRKEAGYGVVISEDGYILTKASEVSQVAKLNVTVDEKNYTDAKVIRVDAIWDVALLKISASGLIPVNYAATSAVPQGTWVVGNGATTRTSRRLLAGIVSAKIREIPASGGAVLGVVLKLTKNLLEIEEVGEKSGASEAGLQKGDFILKVEGKPIKKIEEIAELLKDRKGGSTVKVTYRRKKIETTVDVRLAARAELFADQQNRNDQMSGEYSARRSGFPRVMQHDLLGSRLVVGGPLLDLDGRCIGMNIARANRAENYAIPVEDLKEIAARMVKIDTE